MLKGILQPKLLGKLEEKIKEIKTHVEQKDARRAVENLKNLTTALSLTDIGRQEVFADVTNRFKEIDQNFYSVDNEQGLFLCYAVTDKELFESFNLFAGQIEHKGVVKQKKYMEPYGANGKYGGIGFEVVPLIFAVEKMRDGILS